MQQVAVGGVDLDEIIASSHGALCGGYKCLDGLVDLLRRQGVRRIHHIAVGDGGGSHDLPSSFALWNGVVTFGNSRSVRGRLSSRMRQLNADFHVVRMADVHNAMQSGNLVVAPDTEITTHQQKNPHNTWEKCVPQGQRRWLLERRLRIHDAHNRHSIQRIHRSQIRSARRRTRIKGRHGSYHAHGGHKHPIRECALANSKGSKKLGCRHNKRMNADPTQAITKPRPHSSRRRVKDGS